MSTTSIFYADAVLFDMDGTLTDSIAAVEAAWGKVAIDLGLDPAFVIAATHGKRAVDNLAQFKPHIKAHEMEAEVTAFEQTILDFADAHGKFGKGKKIQDSGSSTSSSGYSSPADSIFSDSGSGASSRSSLSLTPEKKVNEARRPSFITRLSQRLFTIAEELESNHTTLKTVEEDMREAWKIEASSVDRSVKILPGVKRMISSIPEGRYAVATSGAKTYAYGAMTRVGITPPPVTITADDKRLKAGKPFPDPFLLAAECLGFPATRCVVFEDSPSGIKAGVASGAIVIAVCTSHRKDQIENCGAHFLVENMDSVTCEVVREEGEMKLKFTVQH